MRLFKQNNDRPYLLVSPALLFFFIFVLFGIGMVFAESLNLSSNSGSCDVMNYGEIMRRPGFWAALGLSLQISAVATIISLIIGLFLARSFYYQSSGSLWHGLAWLPMLIPHFAAGYLALLLLSQGGWVSGLMQHANLIAAPSQFPVLINDINGIGIIAAYIWKEIPFVLLMLLPVYHRLDRRYEDVVRTLGGDNWQVFKAVEWPWLFPIVMETGVILFAFIFSAFELPYLLGVTYPKMISVLAYQWFYEGNWSNRPLAMALMAISTVVIVFIAYVSMSLIQRKRYRMMRGR